MKKSLKRQLLDVVQTLLQAEQYIRGLYGQGAREASAPVLSDMQQLAEKMGDTVENCLKDGGERGDLILCLEEYCELLWRFHTADSDVEAGAVLEEVGRGRERLGSLVDGIRETWEIAFFPYKASMWDSMEAVWLAARDEPECEAYVVPIPYYEKNADGSARQLVYEGDKFPDDVPITDWRAYKPEVKRPDAVFIHNPYDDGNYITTVHPQYFSRELKKYTDMLVYIPYFIYGNYVYEHMAVCAGTIFSDKVILQSEEVRDIYIRGFRQWAQENHLEARFSDRSIEEKFCALGSPKADKAVNTKKEDVSLPKEWQGIAKDKRTVLYNTGVSGLLSGNERELDKIEDVINCFQKREDAVLWWRPHPLGESTCVSMRPQLLRRYRELIRRFKLEKAGIFDDTADPHLSIAYTDLYYGDDSSMATMYGLTGKPIVMQNLSAILGRGKDQSVCADGCAWENGRVWFSSGNFNGLFELDIREEQLRSLGCIPGEDAAAIRLYQAVLKDGDDLWLIPCRALQLAKYDLRTGEITKYCLPPNMRTKSIKFRSAYLWEGRIYMLPGNCPAILCFDTRDESMEVYDGWTVEAERISGVRAPSIYAYSGRCVVKDTIYFTYYNTNLVVEFCMGTNRFRVTSVGDEACRHAYITYDGQKFWLAPRKAGTVVRWDIKSGEIKTYRTPPEIASYEDALCDGRYLWLLPIAGDRIPRIHIGSGKTDALMLPSDEKLNFSFIRETEDGILVGAHRNRCQNRFILFDRDGKIARVISADFSGEHSWRGENFFEKNYHADYRSTGDFPVWETGDATIETAMDALAVRGEVNQAQSDCYGKLFKNLGKSGAEILRYVLGCLNEKADS